MNRLGRKISVTITVSILFVFIFYLIINSYLLPKYYLFQMKNRVHELSSELNKMPMDEFKQSVTHFEQKYNVTIVYEPTRSDLDQFNGSLRDNLIQKRVTLNKFWVTDQTLKEVKSGKRISKIYDQGKLKSSFLVDFIQKDNLFIVVGVSIVYLSDAVQIVNKFTIYIMIFLIVLLILMVWIWSKKITDPLKELKDISKEIAQLEFKKAKISTNDEIEELAKSINEMSDKLKVAHEDLNQRNANLKIFISDISHELKTPLALIKAYSAGIKDGIDDGTYIDTIIKQTDQINRLIDKLLELSRIEREIIKLAQINVIQLFDHCLRDFDIELNRNSIILKKDYNPTQQLLIEADRDQIEKVFNNLISNAIKYTNNREINIQFLEDKEEIIFILENETNLKDSTQIQNIWDPFYVMEPSRNKHLTGTGLGLAIVKSILNRHQLKHEVKLSDGKIQFSIHFPKPLL
ncbi:HAMP domain-containing sensor histidine kinase [Bacillus sp. AFS041924]|uniref:HAMP domain-containing sensor histidine kinase n=1 Tax=Bacillus sp. AFS041924 TaxID=2033503 RepID=UPI000BFC7C04|nr:HAMP domain-containing sensor histidine kinase [Bacillus sp. AFS041924]PGS49372.1 two-component sensor histidine kinase [Bacillus sp. AFS041924]